MFSSPLSRSIACLLVVAGLPASLRAQTAPTPQPLPYSQNFGTAAFTALPAGVAAWGGLNGANIDVVADAASSSPTADSTLTARTTPVTPGGAGGSSGYAESSNARFYIQTSSNATNGVNQLAVAVNTVGRIGIVLGYDVEMISAQPRTVGTVCQYRIGSSGTWTTITPTSGINPYSQAGGTTGVKTTVSATLPPAAENQANLQIRWATWRGTETGNSSGLAIDNISVTGNTASTSLVISAAPASFSESAGANASVVTVTSLEPVVADTSVTLVSGDTSEAVVGSPNPAIIPAGGTSVTFPINAVDDLVFDGTQTVSLQATAVGMGTVSTNVTVTDDEDAYSPPVGYYAPATGLAGAPLKSALNSIIKNGHVQFTYGNTLNALRTIYEDPANTSNVILVYSGNSVAKTAAYFVGADPDTTFSKEHAWPDSFGLDPTNVNPGSTDGDAGPDFTDLFNLRPTYQTVNNQRSNKYYDETTGTGTVPPLAPACSYDSDSFEPRTVEKGDLARAMFYMATRYDGTEALTLDLEISNTPTAAAGVFAKLTTLLKWAEDDPVSDEERRRNQVTYGLQHNRNPFIDHPEYLALIWGSLKTDETSVAVEEGGATDTYHLTLTSQPTADVVVNITSDPGSQLTTNPSTVTFTTANWNQPVEVTVTAVNDAVYETTQTVTIHHTLTTTDPYYSTLGQTDLAATVTDNDPVIAPASLPLAYGGPWNPLPSVGFSGQFLGSPYASSLGGDTGTGSAKFDDTGDQLTVAFDGPGNTLSYNLKANPSTGTFAEGLFQILQSPDNVTFTELRAVTNKTNVDQAFTDTLASSTRFVLFKYTTKVSGNIQLDKLSITPSAASPSSTWLALYGLSNFSGDGDFDGLTDLAEYALGGSPALSDRTATATGVTKISGGLQISAVVRISDTALTAVAQTTSNLADPGSWTSVGVTKLTGVSQTGVPSGFERVIFEVSDPASTKFLRLVFQLE